MALCHDVLLRNLLLHKSTPAAPAVEGRTSLAQSPAILAFDLVFLAFASANQALYSGLLGNQQQSLQTA
jgi:hypothetical protein